MQAPHLLILDEPTNHLDIDSRRALLDALNDYEGAVILITHDRSLIELVADRLWLTADGRIKPFAGDMDDYARFVLDRAKAGSDPSAIAPAAPVGFDAAAAARLAARRPPRSAAAGGIKWSDRRLLRLAMFKLRHRGGSLYKRGNFTRGPWP